MTAKKVELELDDVFKGWSSVRMPPDDISFYIHLHGEDSFLSLRMLSSLIDICSVYSAVCQREDIDETIIGTGARVTLQEEILKIKFGDAKLTLYIDYAELESTLDSLIQRIFDEKNELGSVDRQTLEDYEELNYAYKRIAEGKNND